MLQNKTRIRKTGADKLTTVDLIAKAEFLRQDEFRFLRIKKLDEINVALISLMKKNPCRSARVLLFIGGFAF